MLDDYAVPGVVVSLRLIETSVATPDAALDRLADQEPGCTVAERQNAAGLPGARMQTMINCWPQRLNGDPLTPPHQNSAP